MVTSKKEKENNKTEFFVLIIIIIISMKHDKTGCTYMDGERKCACWWWLTAPKEIALGHLRVIVNAR